MGFNESPQIVIEGGEINNNNLSDEDKSSLNKMQDYQDLELTLGSEVRRRINNDIDGDGIPNNRDNDMDGDSILNTLDLDIDGDGIPNNIDMTPNGEALAKIRN